MKRRLLLEAISKTPKEQFDAAKVQEGQEVLGVAFITNHQATKVAKMGKKPFNLPAAFVASQLSTSWAKRTLLRLPAVLSSSFLAVSPVGRNHLNACFSEFSVERVAVIGFVAD